MVKCVICKREIDKQNACFWGVLKKYYCKQCFELYIEWEGEND